MTLSPPPRVVSTLGEFFFTCLLIPTVFAATTLDVNPVTKRLDLILDNSNMGVVTGITATFTGYDCTTNTNGGALTTDAAGNLRCSDDDTGGTLNSFVTWGMPLGANVVADSSTDTVTFTSTGPLVIFGTAASDTVAWNIQDAGLTEVMLKVVDTAADEECLTFETTTGDFEWQTCGGTTTNSFETWTTPSGTSPVADSATDTATFTASGIVVTGTAGSDTIDFTIDVQLTELTGDVTSTSAGVTTIQPNAVVLGTDTTNAYVTDLTAGTYIDVSGGGAETATVTVDVDATEIEAVTFGAGGNASNIWTVNLSGTDPTLTFGSALVTVGGGLTTTGNIIGVAGTFSGLLTGSANVTVGNGVSAGTVTLLEGTGGGTNFKAFASPAAITANTTCTFEDDANFIPDSCVGDGSDAGGTDTNADKEFWWPAPAMLPLEAAESIPPIAKDTGTNVDLMTVDFDQTTDECRTVDFIVPPDITAGSTVTFTVMWYAASVTTNDTIWDFRHNSGVADGVDPDAALTTEASAASTAPGTAGQIEIITWTETQTNLAWAASDLVVGVVCRDADNASDNFAADAKVIGFGIRIPRS